MTTSIEILGIFAGFFTVSAGLPQIAKAIQTKSTNDISWLFLVFINIGSTLWIPYGVVQKERPIVYWNIVNLLIYLTLTILKIRYRNHNSQQHLPISNSSTI